MSSSGERCADNEGNLHTRRWQFGYFSLRSGTLFLIVGLYAALRTDHDVIRTHADSTPPNSHNHVMNPVSPEIEMTYLLPGK